MRAGRACSILNLQAKIKHHSAVSEHRIDRQVEERIGTPIIENLHVTGHNKVNAIDFLSDVQDPLIFLESNRGHLHDQFVPEACLAEA